MSYQQRHLLADVLPPLPDVAVDMNQVFSYPIPYETFNYSPDEITLEVTLANGEPLPNWISVEQPSFNPTLLSSLDFIGYINDVEMQGNYAYLSAVFSGLVVLDMHDKNLPVLVSSFDRGISDASAYDLALQNDYVYLTVNADDFLVISVSNPLNPSLADTGNLLSTKGVAVQGNYAVVSHYYDGTYIFDISQPTNIRQVASLQVGMQDNPKILFSGQHAYLMGKLLQVIDMSSPAY